jgi:hypothetical protein
MNSERLISFFKEHNAWVSLYTVRVAKMLDWTKKAIEEKFTRIAVAPGNSGETKCLQFYFG